MVTVENIQAVIAAAGPRDGAVDGILEITQDEWVVRYPDLDIALEFDAPAQRLAIAVDLGPVEADDRAGTYATLLRYSLLWRDTGGVQMALDAEGVVVLQLVLFAPEVDVDLLSTVLPNVVEKARLLRRFVGGGAGAPPASLNEAESELSFIRV